MTASPSIAMAPRGAAQVLAFNLTLAGAYAALAWAVAHSAAGASLIWPSAAIAVFGVSIAGWRATPGILLGGYWAHASVNGWSTTAAAIMAGGDALGVLFAWWLLQRLRRPWAGLHDMGDTLSFVAALGLLAPAVSAATETVAALLVPLPPKHADYWVWFNGWVGAMCGILVYAPPLMLWWQRWREPLPRPTPELVIVPLLALLGTALLYLAPPTRQALPMGLSTLLVLPMLWAAMRLSMRLSSLLVAALFTMALAGTSHGLGPMTALPVGDHMTALQIMGLVLACAVLVSSSLARERSLALQQLRESNSGLERAVERRTAALVDSQHRLQQRLRFQDSLLSALPNPTAYTAADGRLTLVNKALTQALGRDHNSMLGRQPSEVFEDSLLHTWHSMDQRVLAEQRPLSQECRQPHADGDASVWILNKAQVADSSGVPLGIVTSLQDISELKRLQDQLQRDEQRFRFLVDETPMPMTITRLRDSALLFTNRASEELFRAKYADHAGKSMRGLWVDQAQRDAIVAQVLRDGVVRGLELKFRRFDGSFLWLLLSIAQARYGDEDALIFAFKDMTHTKQRESNLQELAFTDSLTGVSNRRHFLAQAATAFHEARRTQHALSLLAIDVDHFKQLNDVYGHPAGDRALRQFADVCKTHLRGSDLFGRLGGDEFAVILPRCDCQLAYDFAQRLRLAVQEATGTDHAHLRLQLTVSIGVAESDGTDSPDTGVDDVLARADQALYQAKQRGRNRVELWSPHLLALR